MLSCTFRIQYLEKKKTGIVQIIWRLAYSSSNEKNENLFKTKNFKTKKGTVIKNYNLAFQRRNKRTNRLSKF